MTERFVLGDYVELQRGNTYKSALLEQPGPVLLGLASIARNGGFRKDSLRTYGGESDERMLLRPGDIFVSLKDVTQSADLLGAVARVPRDVPLGRLTQDTVKLKFRRESDADRRYIYWVLRGPEYREYCRARAIGTTNLSLTREDFLSYPIRSPSTEDIGGVELLEALDDKIELNRRLNEALEAIARAFFKSWFVDFDPVRAKVDGLAPAGMELATARLFPDSMEASERGPVPRGWRHAPLLDVAELISGGTPKTTVPAYWGGSIKWASAKDVSQCGTFFLLDSERTITEAGVQNSSTKILPADCVVVVARGATCGRFAVLAEPMAMNQTCYGLSAKAPVGPWSLRFHAEGVLQRLVAQAHGSVFDTITTSTFELARVEVPPPPVLAAFEDVVAPLVERIRTGQRESATLATLRDALLPKLLSGALRVRDAEKAVGQVA